MALPARSQSAVLNLDSIVRRAGYVPMPQRLARETGAELYRSSPVSARALQDSFGRAPPRRPGRRRLVALCATMTLSVFDLFTIGIGPSSSHTVGPMVAARAYALRLQGRGLLASTQAIAVHLHGSLGATGRAHGA